MAGIGGAVATVLVKLLMVAIDEYREHRERKRQAKASKPHESWMKEDAEELIQEMKAMREDLQKGQEGTNWLIQLLRADLNKEQGQTEEGNPPKAQGSGMEEILQQLFKEMEAMCEDFPEELASTKRDIQLLKDLNKELETKRAAEVPKPQESWMKEEFQKLIQQVKAMREGLRKEQEYKRKSAAKASKPQESWMKVDFEELIQEMKAMRDDFQEWLASTHQGIRLLRTDMKRELGQTEERNRPKAQGSGMEKTLLQLIQKMEAMREDFPEELASTHQDIRLLQDLNKELDRKMKKMAKAQESKMDKEFQQLRQRIQTLEQELHGVPIESASEDEGTDTDAQTTPELVKH